jgi:hypothetical protein
MGLLLSLDLSLSLPVVTHSSKREIVLFFSYRNTHTSIRHSFRGVAMIEKTTMTTKEARRLVTPEN